MNAALRKHMPAPVRYSTSRWRYHNASEKQHKSAKVVKCSTVSVSVVTVSAAVANVAGVSTKATQGMLLKSTNAAKVNESSTSNEASS